MVGNVCHFEQGPLILAGLLSRENCKTCLQIDSGLAGQLHLNGSLLILVYSCTHAVTEVSESLGA